MAVYNLKLESLETNFLNGNMHFKDSHQRQCLILAHTYISILLKMSLALLGFKKCLNYYLRNYYYYSYSRLHVPEYEEDTCTRWIKGRLINNYTYRIYFYS